MIPGFGKLTYHSRAILAGFLGLGEYFGGIEPKIEFQPYSPSGYRRRCRVCGFKVRGDGHNEGTHHKAHALAKVGSMIPGTLKEVPRK